MLYCGVESDHLYRSSFYATVLSDAFALLGEKRFFFSQPQSWCRWLEAFKNVPNEPVHWFIDAADWYESDYAINLFGPLNDTNRLFLVNHRTFCNLMQFLNEWRTRQNPPSHPITNSMVLASTPRLFAAHDLKTLTAPDDFF